MARTPATVVEDYLGRGRTLEQIRAIAVAMNNDKLRAYVNGLIAGKTAQELAQDPAVVPAEVVAL